MNLLQVQNRIVQLMARWVAELKGSASTSHTDPNIASEYIALQLLREVYDWPDLRNLNTETARFPGIDLAGDTARVAIQVTSTPTLDKVKHTLSEFADEDRKLYERYDRLIIYMLVEKQGSYSDRMFDDIIRGRFTFDKDEDILDYRDLLRAIQDFPLERAQRVLDILEEHFGGDLRAGAPPRATALVLPLPADLADFTGRQDQIRRVRDQLDQQGAVAITGIHGMGGIGKTALAVHVAHQLIMEGLFADAQLFIDLKGADPDPVDPVDALQSLLNAILEPDPNRPRDLDTLSALWRRAIQGRDALLILDNAADASQVRPLLPGCPTCAVLITSRRRFNLPGARRLDLRPMPPAEARDLLHQLAPHLDANGADRIAELCGCLPQALRIAGYYLNLNDNVAPGQYASMLADERTRLAQLRDPDDPDLDVAAAISLSVEQLDTDTRRAWALLSLFSAPFDLPAAAALWDQPQDQARAQLQDLRNRCLASFDPDSQRFHQHDLVRLAAADDLRALTEEEAHAAHLRFAMHYERVARKASDLYEQGGDDALQALALFDREWPHIQTGQAWAAAHTGDDDEAAHLCSAYPSAAARILPLCLPHRELIAWLDPALRAARRLGDERGEGVHLGNLGLAHANIAEWDRAIGFYGQSLTCKGHVGDIHGIAQTYNNLGVVYRRKGEWDQAIQLHRQALQTMQKVRDSRGMAQTYNNLCSAYLHKGECDRAIGFSEQALEAMELVGDIHGMAQTYNNLGALHTSKGHLDRAVKLYEQALGIYEQVGDEQGLARTYNNLGLVYAARGEWGRAIESYAKDLDISERLEDKQGLAQTYGNLGSAYAELGQVRTAQGYYIRQLTIAQEICDPQCQGKALWGLAITHAHLGEIRQAREKYRQSLGILAALGSPDAETVRRNLSILDSLKYRLIAPLLRLNHAMQKRRDRS